MTLKELKEEAHKYGYRLVRVPEKILLNPCPICGSKKPSQKVVHHITTGTRSYYYRCRTCGTETQESTSEIQAKKNWNGFVINNQMTLLEQEG